MASPDQPAALRACLLIHGSSRPVGRMIQLEETNILYWVNPLSGDGKEGS